MVTLWGRRWTREELLARVGRLEHRVTETYGLHGRYTGLPARLAGYGAAWDGDDCVLRADGEVLQAALYGEQLLLRRRVEADIGGVSLRITDTVTNIGTVAYVVAMEPSTNRDAGRFDARDRGELGHLAPGEARRYRLEIGALVGQDAIDAVTRRARGLAETPA